MDSSNEEIVLHARVEIKHPALAMLGMMIGSFVGMFSETALNIALPSIMKFLDVSQGTVQWLVTGYMLVIGIFMPLSSLLTRWFKTKKIVLFALAAFIVGAIISAMGSTFSIVLLGRMIQGIGTGLVLPLMFSIALQIFPPNKLGTVMGLAALVIMFAPAIAPTIAGLVISQFAWNSIFWLLVPMLAISFVLVALFLDNVFEQTKTPIDWLSIVESTVGFFAIVIGTSMASDAGWLSIKVIGALVIGVVALILYATRQLHLQSPVLNLHVFSSKPFAVGTLLVMLDFGVILASMYLFPMFLQKVVGLPVAMTGLVMLPGGVVNAVVSGVAGSLYDTHGAKMLSRLGFFIAMIGIVILIMSSATTPLWMIISGHIILMIGAPLAMSPSQTYGLNSLNGEQSADGSAILNTLQQIVGAVSTAIATSMLALGTSNQSGVAGLTTGSHYGFVFVLIVAAAAFIISFQVKDVKQHSEDAIVPDKK